MKTISETVLKTISTAETILKTISAAANCFSGG